MADTASEEAPILDYQADRKRRPLRRFFIWFGAGTGLVVLLGLSVLSPSLCRSRETANRVKCASNLRQIGMAISHYAVDHGGQFPDSFETILQKEDLTASVFTCPSSIEDPATGNTLPEIVAEFRKPGHVSYIYLGSGLTSATVKPETVIAYEPLTNHGDDGCEILFGDMHVDFFARRGAKEHFPELFGPESPSSATTAP